MNKTMRILKFGGSSVVNPERILQVIDILQSYLYKELLSAVVFSAFQGVTDNLIALSKKAIAGDNSYLDAIDELQQRHLKAINEINPGSKQQTCDKEDSGDV